VFSKFNFNFTCSLKHIIKSKIKKKNQKTNTNFQSSMADTPLKAGKNAKPIQNPPEMQTSVSCYFFGSCS